VARRKRAKHPAIAYIDGVLDGSIVVGEYVRLACERQVRDIERAKKNDPEFPFYFDQDAAQHAIDFFQFCHHYKGEWAGKVIELEPWQQFSLWVPFGWKRKGDDTRRFRKVYEEVARKNAKSTKLAGVGNYLLAADGEPGAEVYSAATTRDQAKIIFDAAGQMVKRSPHLNRLIQSYRHNLCIVETASKFEPLSADYNTLDGLNVHAALVDEVHAHKNRRVVDVLESGMGSRRQPFLYMITTAGINAQDSIALEFREYGIKILKRIIEDETFFPLIYTLDENDEWTDERVWPKANPNLNVSVKLDEMRELCRKAIEVPSAQHEFKTKRLNLWLNAHELWLPVERWDECAADFTERDLLGRECFGGLDLSSTVDISAFVLLFPRREVQGGEEVEVFDALPYFWVPEENAELRARRDRVTYPLWIEQGFIEATEGNAVDYDTIRLRINELNTRFNVREIAVDRWNSSQLVAQLQNDGLTMVMFGQGMQSMSAPMKLFEALVMSRRIRHNRNPVLRWMMTNVSAKRDGAGNIKPDKEKSTEKIDGVVAAIMALARASVAAPETSVYETRGLMAV